MDKLWQISQIFKTAEQIPFDNSSKIVLMSDCHRGDGSWTDNFLKNRNIFIAALNHYYDDDYTYIELGDGDELWENTKLSDIMHVHKDTFWLLSKFHNAGRLYLIYGNHDMEKKYYGFVRKNLRRYFDQRDEEYLSVFEHIKVHEGLVLRHRVTHDKILLIHGHQVSTINSTFWMFTKLFVKYVWRPLEYYGVNDPTSPAKNYEEKISVAKKLSEWVDQNKHMLIAGHNHKPSFPEVGQTPYFNDGSCVHPRCITAIEISEGNICLVKWSVTVHCTSTEISLQVQEN
ncbi:MAG: metallophosphoesterase family protein [Ruminiclostridium sp.]